MVLEYPLSQLVQKVVDTKQLQHLTHEIDYHVTAEAYSPTGRVAALVFNRLLAQCIDDIFALADDATGY